MPESSASTPASAKHGLSSTQLLPALCPLCSALGVKARPFRLTRGEPPSLTAHYCEACDDKLNRDTTRLIALVLALCLLTLSISTAEALYFGARAIILQLLGAVAIALGLGYGAGRLFPELFSRSRSLGLWETKREEGLITLACPSSAYSEVLKDHGIRFLRLTQEQPPTLLPRVCLSLSGLNLLWLGGLHALGGAQVRVLPDEKQSVYLLIDSRKSEELRPRSSEEPGLGKSVRVLGGLRRIGLVSDSGQVLAEETLTVWPGSTYIVGQPPPGQCLFWEVRRYGDEPGQFLLPLPEPGPVWHLEHQVDSWFTPLAEPKDAGELPDLQGSGGVRRAVRLLNCEGSKEPLP